MDHIIKTNPPRGDRVRARTCDVRTQGYNNKTGREANLVFQSVILDLRMGEVGGEDTMRDMRAGHESRMLGWAARWAHVRAAVFNREQSAKCSSQTSHAT